VLVRPELGLELLDLGVDLRLVLVAAGLRQLLARLSLRRLLSLFGARSRAARRPLAASSTRGGSLSPTITALLVLAVGGTIALGIGVLIGSS
jgi:hypothetical protein